MCVPARLTYIQHIFLDNGMHDDRHQHVEEDCGQVFDAIVEVAHSRLLQAFCNTHAGVMQSHHNVKEITTYSICGNVFSSYELT